MIIKKINKKYFCNWNSPKYKHIAYVTVWLTPSLHHVTFCDTLLRVSGIIWMSPHKSLIHVTSFDFNTLRHTTTTKKKGKWPRQHFFSIIFKKKILFFFPVANMKSVEAPLVTVIQYFRHFFGNGQQRLRTHERVQESIL